MELLPAFDYFRRKPDETQRQGPEDRFPFRRGTADRIFFCRQNQRGIRLFEFFPDAAEILASKPVMIGEPYHIRDIGSHRPQCSLKTPGVVNPPECTLHLYVMMHSDD